MDEQVTREIIRLAGRLDKDEVARQFNKCVGNKQYGSVLAADREAKAWADAFYEEEKDVFIVIGTGRTHYHRELAARMREGQELVILDWKPPMVAAAFLDGFELNDLARVTFQFSRSRKDMLLSLVDVFDRSLTRRIKFGFIPPCEIIFSAEAQEIKTYVSRFLTVNYVRSITLDRFGMEWTTNIHFNLPHMLKRGVPFNKFENNFRGVSAVIVAAGPSLDKNIHLLPPIMDRAVVIAAGSSIETLSKENGILPHFLASFDAGSGNYPHFQDLDTSCMRLVFIGDIYPPIINEFKGTLVPAEGSNSYGIYKKKGAPHLGELMMGPSVANFALDMAVKMGCNPIILIGQDLAFRDGQSHARGNFYGEQVNETNKYIRVKGNVEEYVYTSKPWLSMLMFFENQLKQYAGKTIVNATEGGAYIQGTEVMTLVEAIEKYMWKNMDIGKKIDAILEMNKPWDTVNMTQEIISGVLGDIKKTREIIDHALPRIERLLMKIENTRWAKRERREIEIIKRHEEKLIKSPVYKHIVKLIAYGRIFYYERYYRRMASEEPVKVEQWVAEYQKVLFQSSREALDAYLECIETGSEGPGNAQEKISDSGATVK